MKLPDKKRPGQQVLAEDFNALLDAVRAAELYPGVGYRLSKSTVGTTLSIEENLQSPFVLPFVVASNGDGTVSVGSGDVLGRATEDADSDLQSYYNIKQIIAFAGDDSVTVTGTGVIYGQVNSVSGNLLSKGGLTDEDLIFNVVNPGGTVTANFGTSMPTSGTGEINFEIAKVSLNSGVAVVDKQVLFCNPDISAQSIGIL